MNTVLPLDFVPIHFNGEIRLGQGEDNWCYGFAKQSGIIAVFDGCGGSGCRTHEAYQNHTEAFMASRLCAGVLYETIQRSFTETITAEILAKRILRDSLDNRIARNVPPENNNGFKMKGLRLLPSTMASILVQCVDDDSRLLVSPIWAGDSRAYVLDANGLSQLSTDDSTQPDPMEGQYDDGIMTNVICGDYPVNLHFHTYKVQLPFIILTATDGCFGYVSTPMEFEGMILHTLLESANVTQWENHLQNLVGSYAQDDHTMCLASFGFDSFRQIQDSFTKRYDELKRDYLETIWATPWENREIRRELWRMYRKNYMKYIGDN
ncbi:MAG: hypothetical protein IJ744_11205 [Lachnospiraceae bacterium]|nr:hypothetical protein [Lachnospiraceae bacterium]